VPLVPRPRCREAQAIPAKLLAHLQQLGFGDNGLSLASTPLLTGTVDGLQLGGFIGYRHQVGNFVSGGELGANEGATDTTLSVPIVAISDSLGKRTSFLRAGVEVGYAFERFLPFATAGFASLTFRDTASGNTRGKH
jgi:hypothetical protein